jgi:protein-disulfide isomerase
MKLRQFMLSSALGIAASVFLISSPNSYAQELSPIQTKQVEKIVHHYIVKNPSVLVDAFKELRQQQANNAQKKAKMAIDKNAKQLFGKSTSPVLGNKQGDVTVVEFLDYQCHHCKMMKNEINTVLKGDEKVRVVIKELPIFGPESIFAAKAAIASEKQGKFHAMHDALLASKRPLPNKKVLDIAKSIGVDVKQLEKDMQNPAIQEELKANQALAESIGLVGTPAFIVSNKKGSETVFMPGRTDAKHLQEAITKVR